MFQKFCSSSCQRCATRGRFLRAGGLVSLVFLSLSVLTGCQQGGEEEAGAGGPLSVVATTTMISDMVAEVGGDKIQVFSMMGPGVDPHLYKPTASDIGHLKDADVIFYNGLFLEGRMAELFDRLKQEGKPVHAVSDKLPEEQLLNPAQFHGHPDPHIWGDAGLWATTVSVVVEGLSKADPENAAHYEAQGNVVREKYQALHEWALKKTAELPKEKRVLVTSHDAFNYLGRAYGFEVVGVQGISTVSEAGLADLARTVDFIKQRKVKAIFVESSVPRATIERISKDSGAVVGGELFSDAMGTPGELEDIGGEQIDLGTYEGMLKHNLNTAVEALK